MTSQKYPRRHPDTAFRPVGDEGGLVVLSEKSVVHVLNPSGITIFGLLDGKHTAEQIAETVADEFEVTQEKAMEDVQAFLGELETHGMLADPQESDGE